MVIMMKSFEVCRVTQANRAASLGVIVRCGSAARLASAGPQQRERGDRNSARNLLREERKAQGPAAGEICCARPGVRLTHKHEAEQAKSDQQAATGRVASHQDSSSAMAARPRRRFDRTRSQANIARTATGQLRHRCTEH